MPQTPIASQLGYEVPPNKGMIVKPWSRNESIQGVYQCYQKIFHINQQNESSIAAHGKIGALSNLCVKVYFISRTEYVLFVTPFKLKRCVTVAS